MTTKTISLPDPLWQAIGRRVRSGECRDESEYLARLAEADLKRQKLDAWDRLAREMDEGMARPLRAALTDGELDEILDNAENAVVEESSSASGA